MSAITASQLDELERKAKAATPGPWTANTTRSDCDFGRVDGPSWPVAQVLHDFDERPLIGEDEAAHDVADAAHIAANSPDVTLQLVAIARAALALDEACGRGADLPVMVERLRAVRLAVAGKETP